VKQEISSVAMINNKESVYSATSKAIQPYDFQTCYLGYGSICLAASITSPEIMETGKNT